MASGTRGMPIRELERLYTTGTVGGLTEGQLLERFVARNDAAAFEAILMRHGPMVMTVCRRWLRDPNDVDDAFQATFLVLVRKAGSLRQRELLGNWLYGVASRVAVRARAVSSRRKATETLSGRLAESIASTESEAVDPAIHEEVHRLPEKYRAPIVLCYLEGLTHEEAAEQLRWPVGTVKGRLARARDLLRSRLGRRGVTVASSAAIAESLVRDANATVPLSPQMIDLTIRVATNQATAAAAGILSAQAVSLSKGVIRVMTFAKLKMLAVAFAVAGAVVSGAGVYAYQGLGLPPSTKTEDPPHAKNVPKGVTRVPGYEAKKTAPSQMPPPTQAPPGGGGFGMSGSGPGGGGFGGGLSDDMNPDKLRVRIAQLAAQIVTADKSPKTKELLTKLEEPVTMAFVQETPLEDVLKYIKKATQGSSPNGIPIYIDPRGLQEAEKTLASPVTIDLEGVPLNTSLRLLLKQVDLAYCVRNGVLIISSVSGVYQELMEAKSEIPLPDPPRGGSFQ